MPGALMLVTGPVASGKTAVLLDRYHAVAPSAIGACLWLAPSERACDTVRTRLAAGGYGILSPNLMTFPDFARRVVRASDFRIRFIPELHQRLLLDNVLFTATRAGAIPEFAAVADSRGFADAVYGFLTELKGQDVSPAAFARTVEQLHPKPTHSRKERLPVKAAQVADLVARYQQRMTERELVDREATYERARQLWSQRRRGPFSSVRTVFVDGFLDFTPPQLAMLQVMLQSVEQLWVTALTDRHGDDSRAELFARPLGTLAKLTHLSATRIEIHTDHDDSYEPPVRPAGLTTLERSLFRPERPAKVSDASGVRIIEAPGLLGEVCMVARSVKSLLIGGTPAAAIVVTAREIGSYANLAREVFAEYSVPLEVDGTDPLIRSPIVATFLRAIRLAEDGFPFAATTALLRSSYFRPDWAEVIADPDVASQSEILLRLLGEPQGQEAYLRQARQWANEPEPALEDEQAEESRRRRKHKLAKKCLPFLERYFAAWNAMPEQAPLKRFIHWMGELATELGLTREATGSDGLAWDKLWHELGGWVAQEQHVYNDEPEYSRAAFLRLLGTIASTIGILRSPNVSNGVRLLPPDQARHVECDHLFLLGLGERSFPNLGGTDPLFDESERQAFRGAGVDVRCAADRLPDEMLLFYQLVTRPRRQLVLVYSAVDDKGQSLLPSSFLLAARECFTEDAVPVERRRMLIEGFDRDPPLSPAEYRVRWALSGGGDRRGLPSELADHLTAAAAMAEARFRNRSFSRYDGQLESPQVLADIRQRFGPDKVLSPTALESYVACPFQFFLGQVLKVDPLEDPAEEVEHTRRGAAAHRALSRLHGRLRKNKNQTSPDVTQLQLAEELRVAVDEYAGRVSSRITQTLWQLEGQRLIRTASGYGQSWEKFQSKWRDHALDLQPHSLEVEFGLAGAHGPLIIEVGEIQVRIGGRIDRIDVLELRDGSTGFWVIDYKTGRGGYFTATDVQRFSKLQLALYALAVERVIRPGGTARPLGLAYWMVTDGGPKVALPGRNATAWLEATDHWSRFRGQLESWVADLVRLVRGGKFPLSPRSEDCTATCNFGQICRIAQSRSVEKDWDLPLPTETPTDAD